MPSPEACGEPPANHLLASLPEADYRRLSRRLTVVMLEHKQALYEPHEPPRYAYFPDAGIVSLLAPMKDGAQVEAGMIGREGVVGLHLLLGGTAGPFRAVVQVPGSARRLGAADLQDMLRRSHTFAGLTSRYLGAFVTGLVWSVACNSHHSVEQRTCRWLLSAHDRVGGQELALTQEYLAAMLSVRRSGVSLVMSALQKAGLLRYRRGRVTILDRTGLEAGACECYGIICRVFDSLCLDS